MQMGGWFKKELKGAGGYKGLSIRAAGLGAAVMTAAGAKVVSLWAGEIAPALAAGKIEAAT